MDNLRQAAEMALRRLDMYFVEHGNDDDFEATQKLRQALTQHVDNVYMSEERVHKTDKSIHEPVAYVTDSGKSAYILLGVDLEDDTPLYTAPPKREWVGLTDEDRQEFAAAQHGWGELCSAVEAKLKEKNVQESVLNTQNKAQKNG